MTSFDTLVLGLLAGFLAGLLSGMFGAGGAVVSTPAIRALGASPIEAVASTLPSIIPSAISGTARYRIAGLVHPQVVAITATAGVPAAIAGALLTDVVPGGGHILMLVTAGLVATNAFRIGIPVVRTKSPAKSEPVVSPDRDSSDTARWKLAVTGAAAGAMSGLLGVGGGVVMVPLFTNWVGLPLKQALGTSLACVGIIAVPGIVTHALLGHINWTYALPLCVGVIPGAWLGAHTAIRTGERTLRIIVSLTLSALALSYGIAELSDLLSR